MGLRFDKNISLKSERGIKGVWVKARIERMEKKRVKEAEETNWGRGLIESWDQ